MIRSDYDQHFAKSLNLFECLPALLGSCKSLVQWLELDKTFPNKEGSRCMNLGLR